MCNSLQVHAFGTLSGVVMPAFFHNCKKILEVGCFFLDGESREHLVEVSPDGLITSLFNTDECESGMHGLDKDVVIELKSPYPDGKKKMPVHYSVPKYYVPQLILEMKVVDLDLGLYASCSKQSMVVIIVHFDEELFDMIWAQIKKMFDKTDLKMLTKLCSENKEISNKIEQFIKNNCKVICEVPVLRCTVGSLVASNEMKVYSFGTGKPEFIVSDEDIKASIIQMCKDVVVLLQECYEMQRKKATEILLFLVNDTDRMFSDKLTTCVPVAYCLKGYSLNVSTMRKIVDIVQNKLKSEGVNVISESFDGQWANMAFMTKDGSPLTELQFQKYIWSKLGRISKKNLLQHVDDICKISKDNLEMWQNSVFLTVGSSCLGNIKVS